MVKVMKNTQLNKVKAERTFLNNEKVKELQYNIHDHYIKYLENEIEYYKSLEPTFGEKAAIKVKELRSKMARYENTGHF